MAYSGSPYFNTLYTASFNGAPFFVRGATGQFGRRVEVHKYPFRDVIWGEDLGKKPREVTVHGFIIGDDVISQRDWILTVVELPGPGVLIHPTLGIMTVNCLGLQTEEKWDQGRVIELTFSFIEAGQKLFPSIVVSTANGVNSAGANVNSAASSDFISQATNAVAIGGSVVTKGVIAMTTAAAIAQALLKGATNLANTASSLTGSFGRFSSANTGSSSGSIIGQAASVGGIATQVTSLISQGAQSRAAVSTSSSNFLSTIGGL